MVPDHERGGHLPRVVAGRREHLWWAADVDAAAVLDELGVEPAIESLARQLEERSGIETKVEIARGAGAGDAANRLAPELEATIYRLVQESANNAIKHASPSRIAILLSEGDGSVNVSVSDDGRGFDPGAVERSFGLVGMEERVTLAGGKIKIESEHGRGTLVQAELPLVHAEDAGAGRTARGLGELGVSSD